jgi:hypothetical protein
MDISMKKKFECLIFFKVLYTNCSIDLANQNGFLLNACGAYIIAAKVRLELNSTLARASIVALSFMSIKSLVGWLVYHNLLEIHSGLH